MYFLINQKNFGIIPLHIAFKTIAIEFLWMCRRYSNEHCSIHYFVFISCLHKSLFSKKNKEPIFNKSKNSI